MAILFKLLQTIICIYVFVAKIVGCWWFLNQTGGIATERLVLSLAVMFASILLLLLLWSKGIELRHVLLKIAFLTVFIYPITFFGQMLIGFFDAFSKSANSDHLFILVWSDIPNLLSLYVLSALMRLLYVERRFY